MRDFGRRATKLLLGVLIEVQRTNARASSSKATAGRASTRGSRSANLPYGYRRQHQVLLRRLKRARHDIPVRGPGPYRDCADNSQDWRREDGQESAAQSIWGGLIHCFGKTWQL